MNATWRAFALALQQNLAASAPDKKLFGAVNSAALDAHKKSLDALAASLPKSARAVNGRASAPVHEADPPDRPAQLRPSGQVF
jgi:hypothetical protein